MLVDDDFTIPEDSCLLIRPDGYAKLSSKRINSASGSHTIIW